MTETAHNPDQRVPCAVPACGTMFPVREMASLTDKHNHGWYICPDCIDKLWKQGHPFLADEAPPVPGLSAELERTLMALATFVGSVHAIATMLEDGDYGIPRSFLDTLGREINRAREVYDRCGYCGRSLSDGESHLHGGQPNV
jgi:hypothetical protein